MPGVAGLAAPTSKARTVVLVDRLLKAYCMQQRVRKAQDQRLQSTKTCLKLFEPLLAVPGHAQ